MIPSRSSNAESLTSLRRWFSHISSFIGKPPTPELDLESSGRPIRGGNVTEKTSPSKWSSPENLESEEKPGPAHSPECLTNDNDIRQRSPSGHSLPLDEHSSYQERSILSAQQFASPSTDPALRSLVPRTPTQGDRYTRERSPPDAIKGSEVVFRSGPRPIQKVNNLPDEWVEDVHPEGQLLYSRVLSSRNLKIRIHTDLALRKTENHLIIKGATDRLLESLDSSPDLHDVGLVDSDIEASILVREDYPDEFGYYLVNHQDQTVFWLEEVMARDVDMWAYDEDIYRHKLAEQYWRHVTDYPHHCSLSSKVWDQLGPLMLLGAVDQEYCEDSTAPKDAQTLGRLEAFWHQAKDQRDIDVNKAACNWICARLWYDFVTPRIHNFWGTDYARLERTITVGEDPRPSQAHQKYPWFIRFVCLFLLWDEPVVTMRLLDDAWPGGIIYPKPWREMMSMFQNEWEKIFVLSAVTFAGAMAFLAIPVQALQGNSDPMTGQDPSLAASFAICCGIACCAFSVASLIAASNLKRDFGGKIAQDVHEAGDYLRSLYSDSLGYLKWGICLSLPRVLFQWAFRSAPVS
ncbi:hypothetical protein M407DRAFT_27834 [Tulasnella calospora MUT 4182]|uniref:Uncharacterized protein n=1 Tax=Tulasnella calospora MUT 4182 TaxID=1051891 RepID=A0A0C3KMN9_9AGAM|nr:hypothetical protein M407DRAFT_27834 [Tulasnella calospora MUT 4182]